MKKIQFETFRKLHEYEKNNLTNDEPSSFNGDVRIIKYRVTFEKIEEQQEVLEERLQKLWDECDNMHHFGPIKAKAKEIGYELKGTVGSKRKKKR